MKLIRALDCRPQVSLALALALLLGACQSSGAPAPPGASSTIQAAPATSASGSSAATEATVLRIANQPGLGYLPLIVIREQKLLEKRVPGLTVEWIELTSGPAIRDAMLAGKLDVGSGGTTPFIQGYDKGVKWKVAAALVDMPLFMNTWKPNIKTLKDFGPDDRIASPAPGSIQHITLQMAAKTQLGDPHALDNRLVTMAHPDALAALKTKREITAHFTSPPFQYDELEEPGVHTVLDSYEVLGGPATFTCVYTTIAWHDKNPKLYAAFVAALDEAIEYINKNPKDAAELFVKSEKSKDSPERILSLMEKPGVAFKTTPTGLMKYAQFMKETDGIKAAPSSWKDFVFENVQQLPGN